MRALCFLENILVLSKLGYPMFSKLYILHFALYLAWVEFLRYMHERSTEFFNLSRVQKHFASFIQNGIRPLLVALSISHTVKCRFIIAPAMLQSTV